MKKVVVITGTSSGLGLEAAILFAKQGTYKVYATMRHLSKKAQLENRAQEEKVVIDCLQLDVTDSGSIDQCMTQILSKENRIDILINNAGGGFAKTTEQATEDEMQWVTDLNYHGVVRCTKAVLPIMRKQQSGHILNITSVGGLVGQPFNEFYCGAKFAVEGYTESLASYVTDAFGIHFSIIEPGGISTEFMASATAKTVTNGQYAQKEYLPIFQKYIQGAQKRASEGKEQVYQNAAEVAEVVLQVAQSPSPPLRVRTSKWAENFCRYKTQSDPDGTKLVNEIKEKFLK